MRSLTWRVTSPCACRRHVSGLGRVETPRHVQPLARAVHMPTALLAAHSGHGGLGLRGGCGAARRNRRHLEALCPRAGCQIGGVGHGRCWRDVVCQAAEEVGRRGRVERMRWHAECGAAGKAWCGEHPRPGAHRSPRYPHVVRMPRCMQPVGVGRRCGAFPTLPALARDAVPLGEPPPRPIPDPRLYSVRARRTILHVMAVGRRR